MQSNRRKANENGQNSHRIEAYFRKKVRYAVLTVISEVAAQHRVSEKLSTDGFSGEERLPTVVEVPADRFAPRS
jgi:hypothetical protein